jgi:hypothetical protein
MSMLTVLGNRVYVGQILFAGETWPAPRPTATAATKNNRDQRTAPARACPLHESFGLIVSASFHPTLLPPDHENRISSRSAIPIRRGLAAEEEAARRCHRDGARLRSIAAGAGDQGTRWYATRDSFALSVERPAMKEYDA